ncbi:MAG: hypothetical protein K8L99_02185 [Anaerolineae bacterium]|nr:hypothetical protein [Anaerolineae bacterium]
MSIEGMIGAVILVVVTLFGIGLPFLRRRWTPVSASELAFEKAREELLTTYERVLATIRDLDEDYQTGKLSEDTYQQERAYWTERGMLLLEQLEPDMENEVKSKPQRGQSTSDNADQVLDDAIEQAIKAYRQAQNV